MAVVVEAVVEVAGGRVRRRGSAVVSAASQAWTALVCRDWVSVSSGRPRRRVRTRWSTTVFRAWRAASAVDQVKVRVRRRAAAGGGSGTTAAVTPGMEPHRVSNAAASAPHRTGSQRAAGPRPGDDGMDDDGMDDDGMDDDGADDQRAEDDMDDDGADDQRAEDDMDDDGADDQRAEDDSADSVVRAGRNRPRSTREVAKDSRSAR
ncbi:hypothetical protein ACQP00_26870 [Dactylosporangium sp. CS-047395]|uniref:hypothetical protein n=1 Tax=Dactylosporangium sp. CS-047395 TaxID=3239936 RepID=UPI003D8CA2A7